MWGDSAWLCKQGKKGFGFDSKAKGSHWMVLMEGGMILSLEKD